MYIVIYCASSYNISNIIFCILPGVDTQTTNSMHGFPYKYHSGVCIFTPVFNPFSFFKFHMHMHTTQVIYILAYEIFQILLQQFHCSGRLSDFHAVSNLVYYLYTRSRTAACTCLYLIWSFFLTICYRTKIICKLSAFIFLALFTWIFIELHLDLSNTIDL